MDELRFDGRVAVVTGAGRGIGRAYAELLARRGARVVVNDLGGDRLSRGSDPEVAELAAEQIRAAGGRAVADTSDVSTEPGASALVRRALDEYGQVDILVNNAGIFSPDGFPAVELTDFQRYFRVHTESSFNVTRAAWPHMAAAGYGRVVLTTSHGILGIPFLISYGAAKGATFALGRALAEAGREHGIKVNNIAPHAATRLTARDDAPEGDNLFDQRANNPDLVAPLVAYLCHESCPVTGETFLSGARRMARIFLAETEGYVHPAYDLTPETVAEHWAAITDESAAYRLTDTLTWTHGTEARTAAVPATD